MSDTMLLDELARRREAVPPARDRLITTLFLVSALHALVILGVTFRGAVPGATTRGGPTLEVLLVHDPVAELEVNTAADYLAQVNQHGAGTEADARHAESPHTPAEAPGSEAEAATTDGNGVAAESTQEDLLATAVRMRDRRYFAHGGGARAGSPLVMDPADAETYGADTGDALHLKGTAKRELLVTANTRESSVAVYIDGWRHKVERVGTANYPIAARRSGLSGNPELEVQILADGRLGSVAVRRSSGHPELDQAALAILKLAAPFEPFPRALARKHDALRLTYEWQFVGGELGESTVRMPSDTR